MALRPPCPDNAAPLYVEAARIAEAGGPALPLSADFSDPGQVRVWAARVEPTLDLLREAGSRSGCQFAPIRQDDRYMGPVWVAPRVDRLATALGASAVAAAQSGNGSAAAERLRLGFVLARHFCQDPLPGPPHVAWNMDRDLLPAAAEVLARCSMPPQAARELAGELGAADYAKAHADGISYSLLWLLAQHRWYHNNPGLATIAHTPPGGLAYETAFEQAVYDAKEFLAPRALTLYFASPLYAAELLGPLCAFDKARELSPYPWRDSATTWQRCCVERGLLPFVRAGETLGHLARHVQDRDAAIARRALLQAALALHEYNVDHGAFPDALSEVHIEGLPIPEDVFSGKPFIYRRKGDGFVLYSIGPNLRDDGGWWALGGPQDDVVWPPPAPPKQALAGGGEEA